ncbi:MAG: carboxymuconolactone decarboxylase family protein [Ilumatobacteraceae bacterium]
MGRITPIPRADLPQYEPIFELVEQAMGFLPSSMPTMARLPALFEAFGQFAATVMSGSHIDSGLTQLVAHIASTAAGCQYCQAHTAAHAGHLGVDAGKIAAVWDYETDDRFSDAERAALRLARDAALVPNMVTDEHFEELRRHYTDEQIVQLVSIVGLFGYLNRWNDTMATTLEAAPLAFASEHLGARGWTPGKHAAP